MFVDDLYCEFDKHLDLLLFTFSQKMRLSGYDSICVTYAGTPFLGEALVKNHFVERPLDDRPLVLFAPKAMDPGLRSTLTQSANWLMLDGELDL